MLFNWIFATKTSEIGLSWFDFYSFGHLAFGIGAFLFVSLLYTIPKSKGYTPIFSLLMVMFGTITILILWEVWENYILFVMGWEHLKFEGRADSLQNGVTDVLVGIIGAFIALAFCYLTFEQDRKIWPYYTFGIISLFVWIGIFIILRALTLVNSPVIS